jgi:hypothetical protein
MNDDVADILRAFPAVLVVDMFNVTLLPSVQQLTEDGVHYHGDNGFVYRATTMELFKHI